MDILEQLEKDAPDIIEESNKNKEDKVEVKPDEQDTVETDDNEDTNIGVDDDIMTNSKIIDKKMVNDAKDLDLPDSINHPSGSFKEYEEFNKILIKVNDNFEAFRKSLSDLQLISFLNNFNSRGTTIKKNVLHTSINSKENKYKNDIEFGDKKLNTRTVDLKVKEKVSTATAVARFNSFIGVGEVIQVPLWHSGFWVTIRPIKQKDFVNLNVALNSNAIDLGRSTSALIYSNYSVVFIRIVTDFIIDNIVDTTLKLDEGEDIRKYIKTQDLYPLINGLLTAMYPKGIDITKTCVNGLKYGDNNKPLCDSVITGRVDTKKLLWVNRAILTNKQLSHMTNKQTKSVTLPEVIEYQNTLKVTKAKTVTIPVTEDNNKWVKFTILTPNLLDYVNIGEQWVNDIITFTQELFIKDDNDDVKNTKINDVVLASRMNMYNSYINKIETSDGVVLEETDDITSILDVLSQDEKMYNTLLDEISNYVEESVIAIVATPNYVCPKCETEQNKENSKMNKVFKEFIPLNLLENFFDLSLLRIKKIRQGDIS